MKKQETSKPICISYIRFSTPEQLKGNSLKRQLQNSQEYAENHGLFLDERFNYKDLGLSAYHGEHKTKGALGSLLELVDKGKIPQGSVLLIESLDRLSRDRVREALSQFLQIIDKGIKIITLIDEKEYDKDLDVGQLQYSLGVMARAYDESATKAKRLQDAWKDKRSEIDVKKITAIAPAWLKLNKKIQKFELIPDRCRLIQRIYKLYLDGNGAEKIARILNSENIPAWKSKNGWHKSYTQKILHNKAVIGEYQPHSMDKRKRIAEGEPIPAYFPQVISKEDFYRVQEKFRANIKKGGRTGKISNLFGHIAKCGYCGAPMQYINKGKRDEYLVCDSARRGMGCVKVSFQYKEFEKAFLKCCTELDVRGVLPYKLDSIDKEIISLRGVIEGLEGELVAYATLKKNLNLQLKLDDSELFVKQVSQNLKEALEEEQTLRKKLQEAQTGLDRLTKAEQKAESQLKSIAELLEILKEKEGDELVAIRQKLRLEIRKLVERIEVFPEGLKGKILSLDGPPIGYVNHSDFERQFVVSEFDPDIHPSRQAFKDKWKEYKRTVKKYIDDTTGKQYRRFAIWFQAGGFKEVFLKDGIFEIGVSGNDFWSIVENLMKESYPGLEVFDGTKFI